MKIAGNNKTQQRPPPPFSRGSRIILVCTVTASWTIASYVYSILFPNVMYRRTSIVDMNISYVPSDGESKGNSELHQKENVHQQQIALTSWKASVSLDVGHIDYSDYHGYSRVFTKFQHPFPCFQADEALMTTTPAHEGILFQRPTKVGSTSMSGIVLRLVHNRGQTQYGFETCKHRTMHGSGKKYDYYNRDKSKSFLFSLIRNPQARAISEAFHFDVTGRQREPTDAFLQSRLSQTFNHFHYYDELGTRNYTKPGDEKRLRLAWANELGHSSVEEHEKSLRYSQEAQRAYQRTVKRFREYGNTTRNDVLKDIFDDYDFIAVLERLDESLVALQMLLNLTTKEILYTRARSSGSWSNGFKNRPCMYIIPSFLSSGMKTFLNSDDWKQQMEPDMEFYKAAHKSLDRTIDYLGRSEFEERLRAFQDAMKLVTDNCMGKVRSVCSDGGALIPIENRTCYVWGEGCDHDCIDELDV